MICGILYLLNYDILCDGLRILPDVGGIGDLLHLAIAHDYQGRRLHDAKLFCQFCILLCIHHLIIHIL